MKKIKYRLTKEGVEELKLELRHLLTVKKPEILEQIKAAREQGDLSENADYEAARMEQGKIEGRIQEIQTIIDHVEIIKVDKGRKVHVGSKVTILDMKEKKEYTYSIVGSVQANPDDNKISNESPLARAIMDKEEGETAEIKFIESPYKVKIVKIH
jgi:transcription elongation factor GreA